MTMSQVLLRGIPPDRPTQSNDYECIHPYYVFRPSSCYDECPEETRNNDIKMYKHRLIDNSIIFTNHENLSTLSTLLLRQLIPPNYFANIDIPNITKLENTCSIEKNNITHTLFNTNDLFINIIKSLTKSTRSDKRSQPHNSPHLNNITKPLLPSLPSSQFHFTTRLLYPKTRLPL